MMKIEIFVSVDDLRELDNFIKDETLYNHMIHYVTDQKYCNDAEYVKVIIDYATFNRLNDTNALIS